MTLWKGDVMGQDGALEPKKEAALASLLSGATVTRAAEAAGCSRNSVHRWLKGDHAFLAAYNRGRKELRDATSTRLLALAEVAAGCVARAVDEGDAKVALAMLKGLGLLSGERLTIGPDDPGEVAEEKEMREALAEEESLFNLIRKQG